MPLISEVVRSVSACPPLRCPGPAETRDVVVLLRPGGLPPQRRAGQARPSPVASSWVGTGPPVLASAVSSGL